MVKEKVEIMIAAAKEHPNGEKMLDFLGDAFDSYRKYVNSVVSMSLHMKILYARKEGEELREAIMELDRNRRLCHDVAIGACNSLNNISNLLSLPLFFDGNVENREEVANFAKDFVDEFWFEGRHKDMDLVEKLSETGNVITTSFRIKGEER